MRERNLAFGYNAGIPEEVNVVWGGRWIYPDDMVYDRQDFVGMKTEEGQRLKGWLDNGGIGKAREAARKKVVRPDESREVVLYEDEQGIIKGNPQGSYGYLYVCGYLKGGEQHGNRLQGATERTADDM